MSAVSFQRWLLPALLCLAPGCRAVSTPESTAQAYAQALREGRVSDAHALLDKDSQGAASLAEYQRRYDSAQARARRADEVAAAGGRLTASAERLTLRHGPEGWRVVELPVGSPAPADVLRDFVGAVDRRDFEAAYLLLASPIRARYSPLTFRKDFDDEPTARERLERARSALKSAPRLVGAEAFFDLGPDRSVRLVREGPSYRIAALE